MTQSSNININNINIHSFFSTKLIHSIDIHISYNTISGLGYNHKISYSHKSTTTTTTRIKFNFFLFVLYIIINWISAESHFVWVYKIFHFYCKNKCDLFCKFRDHSSGILYCGIVYVTVQVSTIACKCKRCCVYSNKIILFTFCGCDNCKSKRYRKTGSQLKYFVCFLSSQTCASLLFYFYFDFFSFTFALRVLSIFTIFVYSHIETCKFDGMIAEISFDGPIFGESISWIWTKLMGESSKYKFQMFCSQK